MLAEWGLFTARRLISVPRYLIIWAGVIHIRRVLEIPLLWVCHPNYSLSSEDIVYLLCSSELFFFVKWIIACLGTTHPCFSFSSLLHCMGCSIAQSSIPCHVQELLCFTLVCWQFLSHLRVNKNLEPFFLCATPPSLVVRMHGGTQPAFVTLPVPCWLVPRPVGRPHPALLVSNSCWEPFENASPVASFNYTKSSGGSSSHTVQAGYVFSS